MVRRSRLSRYEAFHYRRSKFPASERSANHKVHTAVTPPFDLIWEEGQARRRRRRARRRRDGPGTTIRPSLDCTVAWGRAVGESRGTTERLLTGANRFSVDARWPRRAALLEGRRRRSARMVARRRGRILRSTAFVVAQTLVCG